MEIELQAQQPPGGIVVLLLEYGSVQGAVRLFELSGNCLDHVLNFKKVRFSEGQPFRRANWVLQVVVTIRLSKIFFNFPIRAD